MVEWGFRMYLKMLQIAYNKRLKHFELTRMNRWKLYIFLMHLANQAIPFFNLHFLQKKLLDIFGFWQEMRKQEGEKLIDTELDRCGNM